MKKLISLFLALVLLCSLGLYSVNAVEYDSDLPEDEDVFDEGKYADNKPEYSIDQDFSDNSLLFLLTSQASKDNPTYTPQDFEGMGVVEVRRITNDGATNHIFYVVLDKHDKQNVLDVIALINMMEGVLIAEPNFASKPDLEYLYEEEFVKEYVGERDTYKYEEVFYHYTEYDTIDWCLVKASIGDRMSGSMSFLKFDDFVLISGGFMPPFSMQYGVYDVVNGKFVDLTDSYEDLWQYDGLMYTLKRLCKIRLIGDCDYDGDLSILDATAIQLDLAKLSTASIDHYTDCITDVTYSYADFDQDGDVSIMDATAIQYKLAGLDVPIGID